MAKELLVHMEQGQMRKNISDVSAADMVVVLGGMLVRVNSASGPAYEWRDPDRYLAGIELIRAHKGHYLFFTSGKLPWDAVIKSGDDEISEGQYLAKFAQENGILPYQIIVSEEVQNTAQEAEVVKSFMHRMA